MKIFHLVLLICLAFFSSCKGGGGGGGEGEGQETGGAASGTVGGASGGTSGGTTGGTTGGSGNTAPTISDVSDQSTNEDTATGAISFTIADAEDSLNCITSVTASSSNTSVLTNASIVIGGTAPNCTATLTPVANASGTSIITLTVSDGSLSTSDTFILTVNAVNDAPTISDVTNKSTDEDTSTSAIAFTVSDVDNTLNCATSVSKSSSNTSVIASSGIVIGGTAPNCTVTLAPVANASGTSTISLTVSDGSLSSSDTFTLTVNAVNDAPTISSISDLRTQANISTSAITFTISDVDSSLSCASSISKSSSNTSVLLNTDITIAGTSPNCTVTMSPVTNALGSSTVTLTVTDGALTANETFNFTSYNPWSTVTLTGAPSARTSHKAVWTGSEMVIWGGGTGLNTGGMYSPSLDQWTTMSTTSAPQGRYWFEMIFDGSIIYVIGGANGPAGSHTTLSSCAKFNPATNTWSSMASLPQSRNLHTAVWTGSRIIAWGGRLTNDNNITNTGYSYNPSSDSWSAISTTGAPSARHSHLALWVGDKMLIWGGSTGSGAADSGALYDPSTDSWSNTSVIGRHTGHMETDLIWTGEKAFIWAGSTWGGMGGGGSLFDPVANTWASITETNAPDPNGRNLHSTIWTGTEAIVWGGNLSGLKNTGGRYNPSTNKWVQTTTYGAPAARARQTAVWTGSQMIIWGGGLSSGADTNTGYIYEP